MDVVPEAHPARLSGAFEGYYSNGFQPLPLGVKGSKGPTPPGRTGYEGRLVTRMDVERWSQSKTVTGVCLRLVDMVGLDVDAYAADKDAAGRWKQLSDELGELPKTWVSSSRFDDPDYDGLSGIRLYRLPEPYASRQRERCWKGNLGPGIDVIRFGHRQVNVWPTKHSRGTEYQWLSEETGALIAGVLPARAEEIPELPKRWAGFLVKGEAQQEKRQKTSERKRQEAAAALTRRPEWWTDGEQCPAVQRALGEVLHDLPWARHDGALRGLVRLTRLGEQGHLGVGSAVGELEAEFIAALEADPGGRSETPESEWQRAVDGVWAEVERAGFTAEENKGCCGPRVYAPDTAREETFFSATPTLSHIRQAAQSRMLSPWAVLASVLARAVAEAPPALVLPPTIGSRASLNMAWLLVGDSSGGKSSSFSCAGDLLPGGTAMHIGQASGEGIVQTFLSWDKGKQKNVLVDDPRALMFVDEVAQLEAVMSRSGSTFGSIMRSVISGAHVGNQNATADRRRNLPAHSYRLAAVCGAQPHLTEVLLNQAEVDAGTPQRWVFMRAKPAYLPDVEPEFPGALGTLVDFAVRGSFQEVQLPAEVREFVKENRRKALLGNAATVDGHLVLTRLKVATALAWLHGELDVTMRWWELAGIVVDESCAVRDECFALLAQQRAEADRAKGRSDARRASGAREAEAEECEGDAELVAKTVANGAHPNATHKPGDGCTGRCVAHALRNRKGADRECALTTATELGWIEIRDGRYFRGESWPSAA